MASRFEENTGRSRKAVLATLTKSALAKVHTYNVRHNGAVADAKTDDAPAINRTIAECSAAGGGTVFVPSGIYAITSIQLKSNITLAFDIGAALKSITGSRELSPLISGGDLDNVNIVGLSELTP